MEPLDNAAFVARYAWGQNIDPLNQQSSKEGTQTGQMWGGFSAWVVLGFFAIAFGCFVLSIHYDWSVADAGIYFAMALAVAGGAVWFAARVFRTRWGDPVLLSAIVHASPAARFVTNASGQAVYASATLCVVLEVQKKPQDLITLSQAFAEPEGALLRFKRMIQDAHKDLVVEEEFLRLLAKDGMGERWIKVCVRNMTGQPGLIHWRFEDVSEAYRKMQAAEAERAGLIDFTDNAPVGFFSLNEEGRFIFANATLARWLGEDLRALVSHGRFHTYMANPPGSDAKPYDLTESGGDRQVAETRLKGPGGQTFLTSITQEVVQGSGPDRIVTRGVVHDVTDERSMRRALKASEDRFQRFFDNAPIGIVLLNAGVTITDCNEAFASMLGIERIEDVKGQAIEALITASDRHAILECLISVAEGRTKEATQEVTLEGRNGPIITHLHARRFEEISEGGAHKEDLHLVLHCIDMTQHRHLENQVAQSQKMQAVGQLAGGIAHDFNNLLTAMIGFCDLLLLRHRPGDPSFSDIMQIKQNANRASNLVRQILAFSRQQTLRPHILDITEVLTELSYLLRRLLGSTIRLDLLHGQDLAPVRVDEVQLEQVLINLSINARDAMGETGTLTITTRNHKNETSESLITQDVLPPGMWVVLSVVDTGCGMDKATLDRIFEPFFTTKGPGQGTGLGLAMVYGIVRQTGGYLDVRSIPNQGTEFRIYLPQAKPEEKEIKQNRTIETKKDNLEKEDLTGSAFILLVEDEDAVRAFSKRALEGKGYSVLSASCGIEALELLNDKIIQSNSCPIEKQPDLLITDVVMPEMDGPTLARNLRERYPDLKIIFISGYTEDRLADHMGRRIWFLPKPFTLRQLAGKVKEAIQDETP